MLRERTTYHRNGHISGIHRYKDHASSVRHGATRTFHYNGALKLLCFFKDGKRHGECVMRSIDGVVLVHDFHYMGNVVDPDDVADYANPTPEELVVLELKYGGRHDG